MTVFLKKKVIEPNFSRKIALISNLSSNLLYVAPSRVP